ncbi:MAG: SET domain-containing protein-lysine N-methyltransferase, partial [Puniceicoccaceae bacterium]|nr:SET domain-containing protein-lysine N-methyltransferase [Puniceicoccaceae bacterium]
ESTKRALEWEEQARETGEGLVYIFELDDTYDIDGRLGENPARYMNHSCDGNCEAINYDGEIWIVARKDIKKGEELVYDYGYNMEHFLDHPCLCGADNCIGYIVREDQRKKVKKLLKAKKKKRGKKRKS